jgi:hypothetical protein
VRELDSRRGESLFIAADFPVPELREHPGMTPRRGRIGTDGPTEKPVSRQIPCIFPVDQRIGSRDEFAPDCLHRQLVCGCRDFAAGVRRGPPEPRDCAGFWERALVDLNRRLRVPGLEDAAVGVCLCCQVGRFGFAFDSPQRRAALNRSNSVPMGAGRCAITRRRTSLYLGIGRVNYPRVGDAGDGEKLNDFN